jgi:hypothetical protein
MEDRFKSTTKPSNLSSILSLRAVLNVEQVDKVLISENSIVVRIQCWALMNETK